MKQIRAIRISFCLCAAVAVVSYWAGYYFGNSSSDPAELITENTTDIYQEEDAGAESQTAESHAEDSAAAINSDGTLDTAENYAEDIGTGSQTAEGYVDGSGAGSLSSNGYSESAGTGGLSSDSYGEYAGTGDLTAEDQEESVGTGTDGTADTVESMTEVSPEPYYLKTNGSYLAVYRGESDEVYFNTGIRLDELPDALQQEVEGEGIAFDDLEGLFGFLENYSS